MGKGVRCVCLDDNKKPKEIPAKKWVKKDKQYTITHIYIHPNQDNIQGVELAELDLTGCEPYSSYKLSRFGIILSDWDKFHEMLKDCSDLNDIEIDDFMKKMVEKEELIFEEV